MTSRDTRNLSPVSHDGGGGHFEGGESTVLWHSKMNFEGVTSYRPVMYMHISRNEWNHVT